MAGKPHGKQIEVRNVKEDNLVKEGNLVKELCTDTSSIAKTAVELGGEANVTQSIKFKESENGTREVLVFASAVVRTGSCA